VLAGIAGATSYSHMRQLGQAHGDAGWHAHAIPLSVDGIEIVRCPTSRREQTRADRWISRAVRSGRPDLALLPAGT